MVLRRTLEHLAPVTPAATTCAPTRDLSAFYHAVGQQTPAPAGAGPDEVEVHGVALPATVSAAPYVGGFGSAVPLTGAEIEAFKTQGFFVKRGLLPLGKVEAALEKVWDHLEGAPIPGVPAALQLPPSGVSRADKASWMDAHSRWPAPDLLGSTPAPGSHASTTWEAAAALRGTEYEAAAGNAQRAPSSRSNGAPNWQICSLGTAPWLVNLLPNDPGVRAIASQLLSPNLRPTSRVRGVYCVFPSSDSPRPLAPHTDRICQQLNAATYLDDVAPGHGAFTVWPKSHSIVSQGHVGQANWHPTEAFRPLLSQVRSTIRPVELPAKKGDVIFWCAPLLTSRCLGTESLSAKTPQTSFCGRCCRHGRLVHTVGRHSGDTVRIACFCDFQEDRPVLGKQEHEALGQFEWWHTAVGLFEDDRPASDGLWKGWAIE